MAEVNETALAPDDPAAVAANAQLVKVNEQLAVLDEQVRQNNRRAAEAAGVKTVETPPPS